MHTFKVLGSAALLLAAIIFSSVVENNIISHTSNRMNDKVFYIEETIKLNNWVEAEKILSDLEEHWAETEKKWAVLIDHFEVDNIDVSIKKLAGYIESRDYSMALAENKALGILIKHIPENTALKLKNIF